MLPQDLSTSTTAASTPTSQSDAEHPTGTSARTNTDPDAIVIDAGEDDDEMQHIQQHQPQSAGGTGGGAGGQQTQTVPFVQSGEPLPEFLRSFWQRQVDTAEQETPDFRHPPLPLARIKKVMKSDPDVKMIAADAPILFCKACEIFIAEITARAFIVADSNKRRTLSRADIAKALSKSDQFDFLIDIVPREEPFANAGGGGGSGGGSGGSSNRRTQKREEYEHFPPGL